MAAIVAVGVVSGSCPCPGFIVRLRVEDGFASELFVGIIRRHRAGPPPIPAGCARRRPKFLPLLKSEWVGCAEERPVGAVKGGRSPAQRTLDGDRRTLQS